MRCVGLATDSTFFLLGEKFVEIGVLGGSACVFLDDVAAIFHELLEDGVNFGLILVHFEGVLELFKFCWLIFDVLEDGLVAERPKDYFF